MNDEQLKDFGVLLIQEPHIQKINDTLVTTPREHSNWTNLVPTTQREGRWPIRSMIWIRKDLDYKQVPVQSPDLTAVVLQLPNRSILITSIYLPGKDAEAQLYGLQLVQQLIEDTQYRVGTRIDVIIAGDFNCHHPLWGGDEVSIEIQDKADPIIDLIGNYMLHSLLPRGTKTWQKGGSQTTVDLMLASDELSSTMTQCRVYGEEHGSDHWAIETIFDIKPPERLVEQRLLFKNAPWNAIRERISRRITITPMLGGVQFQTDHLMDVVLEAVQLLVPKAKPSQYTKRWWTVDLTQLRRTYTYWRNQARNQRRTGLRVLELEQRAKEASKEYHEAIRRQRKAHWDEFLAEDINIWKAAKYLDPNKHSAFDKIPPLIQGNGATTQTKEEQAGELLATFFPPLPEGIEADQLDTKRLPLPFPKLTMEEVERQLAATKSGKAPGQDGLPTVVWKQVWPVVKDRVLKLFQMSLDQGILPRQWKQAKIIPLKKPGKGDYTIARNWRPISLLSTLGKILESVVAERISYMVETYGLLPTNHFGARKKRSTEQALLLLQEHIYKAWRSGKVLSLISFDIKGAYNGVCKERLLQRLLRRGIPYQLIQWIDAFCSQRTASIVVNGYTSQYQQLPQAGLPQGSPLSPILFLFFNADLVQHKLNRKGGAIAFVDDYTPWVIGPSAEANREEIEAIINRALQWERQSGATFEGNKTAIIHFTRERSRTSTMPFTIKGQRVVPRGETKILGVVMDSELRYKTHITNATTEGIKAAMALKRLRMLSPSTARRLFEATVVPVVDYASNIWKHMCGTRAMAMMDRVQRIGAQAITGVFHTVATAVGEAEAYIDTVQERHSKKATIMWINLNTLPKGNPISNLESKGFRRFISPLQRIAREYRAVSVNRLETIDTHAIPPWEDRIQSTIETDRQRAVELANNTRGILIATSSATKNGMIGAGGAIRGNTIGQPASKPITYKVILGPMSEQNPYTAELAAVAIVLRYLPPQLISREITIISSNQGVLQAISHLQQQSGQATIRQIYSTIKILRQKGNHISGLWVPTGKEVELITYAKTAARQATGENGQLQEQIYQARSTTMSRAKSELRQDRQLPKYIGKYSKQIDTALPDKHTQTLYNGLKQKEATVLAQLRTGMARLNGYLHQIGAIESDQCICGRARETVEHFLFRCIRWESQRELLFQQTTTKRGCLSFFLGGKAISDPEKWAPNMEAVRATIRYTLATGRLDTETERQQELLQKPFSSEPINL